MESRFLGLCKDSLTHGMGREILEGEGVQWTAPMVESPSCVKRVMHHGCMGSMDGSCLKFGGHKVVVL